MNSVVTPTFKDLLPFRQKAEISFDLAGRDATKVKQPIGSQTIKTPAAIIPNNIQRKYINKNGYGF